MEHTGKYNKEETAHFGKTLEPKKNKKLQNSPNQQMKPNASLAAKTPSMKLLKGVSPLKVLEYT